MILLAVAAVGALSISAYAKTYLLYVGNYTKGESKGIYDYTYNAGSGELKPLGLIAETRNPSFLAADPAGKLLYAVNEVGDYEGKSSGAVTAFRIDHATGKLAQLNQVASRGADPCYISFDKTGKYALVANYTGGNIAVFPVESDGRIGEASAFVQHTGKGTNPERQEGPHAHWIETSPDNRYAIASDLGLDELLVYHFDSSNGALTPDDPPIAKTAAAAGPRHVSFSPDGKFAYAIAEMNSTITVFSYDASSGRLQPIQAASTLPKDFKGENDTAEIHVHPSGRFLFGSNRGHNSIAVFSIDKRTGHITPAGDFSTQGKTPRNFEIDPTGSRLFVANMDSNNIVVFKIDQKTGKLTPTGQVLQAPIPVSLRFVAQ
jgi:6-phosphogluconolactonase